MLAGHVVRMTVESPCQCHVDKFLNSRIRLRPECSTTWKLRSNYEYFGALKNLKY